MRISDEEVDRIGEAVFKELDAKARATDKWYVRQQWVNLGKTAERTIIRTILRVAGMSTSTSRPQTPEGFDPYASKARPRPVAPPVMTRAQLLDRLLSVARMAGLKGQHDWWGRDLNEALDEYALGLPLRVYIAGPMRGYPEHNVPTFRQTATRLREFGLSVVSPVELGDVLGGQDSGHAPEEYVRNDLTGLLNCNAIALLPGWEKSTGARCEAAVAVTLGFTFIDHQTGQPVEAPGLINIRGGYERAAGEFRSFDFHAHLQRQRTWSEKTFGPGPRDKGVVQHIRKELVEIEAKPADLEEWIDVAILALDGAWRSGASPEQIIAALVAKHEKNESRQWPDWRTQPADQAIEHDRSGDQATA